MKNKDFNIEISEKDGTITSVSSTHDASNMNWCSDLSGWGRARLFNGMQIMNSETSMQRVVGMEWLDFVNVTFQPGAATSIYENASARLTVERSFDENGFFNEKYTLKNLRDTDLFIEQGNFGIAMPFNDVYTYADDCMSNRCNTHIWCGGSTTNICAVKMGKSEINLGLVLTEGACASYSTYIANKRTYRGVFVLDCEHLELLPGEEYVWNFKLFWFKDIAEFNKIIKKYNNTIEITAENFTVYREEPIRCNINLAFEPQELSVTFNDVKLEPVKTENGYYIEYTPQIYGDAKLNVTADGIHTFAEFFVSEEPEKLIEKRLYFIAEKQQYKRKNSALYGAFLPYDNKRKYLIFDSEVRDHNACRERMGMALLMCRYLQNHNDAFLRASLDDFVAFTEREFYDTETGEVFDGIGKNRKYIRLYNAPWVVTFLTEMYRLTGDKKYMHYAFKSIEFYYRDGLGYKFYPNGFSILSTYNAFKAAGMTAESERVYSHFKKHVDSMVEIGLSYPKHEVNYEQTIVSPAVTFISEFALISNDDFYTREAAKHIIQLERFNGHQPSCHLHEIPIRYWDDFWFGKARLKGDTFPHYWSCLTARSFFDFYTASGEEKYKTAAEKCIRNCFCLFTNNGEGSCAYVYPYRVNNKYGKFYDEWANDQDFALYFYLTFQNE